MGVLYGDSHRHPTVSSSRGGHKTPHKPAGGPRVKKAPGPTAVAAQPSGPVPTMPGMKGSGVVKDGVTDTGIGSGGNKTKNRGKTPK